MIREAVSLIDRLQIEGVQLPQNRDFPSRQFTLRQASPCFDFRECEAFGVLDFEEPLPQVMKRLRRFPQFVSLPELTRKSPRLFGDGEQVVSLARPALAAFDRKAQFKFQPGEG